MRFSSIILTLMIGLAFSCTSNVEEREVADRIFLNGKVYTVNEGQPWAEAVGIRGNKIVFVGSNEEAEAFRGDSTRVVDLNGKMVLPGFISAHEHLIASGWMAYGVNLFPAKTKEETLKLIKDYADAHPEEEIVLGYGWNRVYYGGNYPTAAELDELIPDRPAVMIDFTVHDAWFNTKAMEAGGVDKNTPDPVPNVSYWRRDAEGNPEGVGIELPWMPAYVKMGAWQPEKMIPASHQVRQNLAIKGGLTTVLVPGIVTPNVTDAEKMFHDFEFTMEYLKDLDRNGELKVRTFAATAFKDPNPDPADFVQKTLAIYKNYQDDRFGGFGIKCHPEGTWSSGGVLMLEPFHGTDNYGASAISPEKIKQIILAANEQGLDVVTHSEGSATVRGVIDGIEASREAGNSDERNAIHHLCIVTPSDLQRIIDMKIPLNITPIFSTDWSGQDKDAERLLGIDRVKLEMGRYVDAARGGSNISLASDIPSAPLEHLKPLFGIQAAITLQDPGNPESRVYPPGQEGLSLEKAIRAYTINPAWQLRMEDKIGSIETGKYADLVILDQNLFDVDVHELQNVKVITTIMDGEVVFQTEE